ncbi:MAG: hypothetical protein WD651_09595 [Acidimicrobiia bacterium]
MDALHHGEPAAEATAGRREVPDLAVRRLTDVKLDQRIRGGWDVWCELLDELLSTGGMLPSRQLAARTVEFFEGDYWRAEDARIEALRRDMTSRRVSQVRARDRARGLG